MKIQRLQLLSLAVIFGCPAPGGSTETSDGATTAGTTTAGTTTTGTPTTGTPTTGTSTGAPTSATTESPTTDPPTTDPTSTSTTDALDSSSSTTTDASDSSSSTTDSESTTGEPEPAFKPFALEVADFNGDGHADLLVVGVYGVVTARLSLGLGDGSFAPEIDAKLAGNSAYPSIGALDGLVGVDVLMAIGGADAQVYRWGGGAFQPWKTITSVGIPQSHIITDADKNGHDDVVVLWREGAEFGVVLHWGSAKFTPWPRKITTLGTTDQFMIAPNGIRVGHLDGDAFADVLVFERDAPGGFVRALGALDGSFVAPTPIAPALRPWTAALGDFDEDGALDLLAAEHTPARLTLLVGDGDGGFTPSTTVDIVAFLPLALNIVDFDGDGHLDVIAIDDQTPELRLWPGQGNGALDAAQAIPLPSGAVRAHTAFLDGDAKLDLAVATFAAGTVTVLLSP